MRLLLATPILLGAVLVLPSATRRADAGCRAAAAALERRWGGTGEWRALAPYPVAREASPTDTVGVWLERWHPGDGRVAMRRVSAEETVVAELDAACGTRATVHRRTYDSAATAGAFTDARLRDLLRATPRGMVYVWSPGMPLSVRGLGEARAAARALGIAFTAVVADAADGATLGAPTMDALELVYRNATIHYPTALFYRDGAFAGSVVAGYKDRDGYAALGRERLAAPPRARPVPLVPDAAGVPPFWVDRTARVTTSASVPTPRRVGFFFKPVAGTDLISYTTEGGGSAAYLYDLRTRVERRIPGHVDPVPTPDGRFITRPGLVFHPVTALLAGDTASVYTDPELPDEYQSIGILARSRTALRYRVVTGWRAGLRLRDYDLALDRDGQVTAIRPAGAPAVPCPERRFVLPISAKGTREVGVHDMVSETSRIVEVRDDGTCVDRLDFGFATGKLSFSYDGAAVGFATSRVDVDAAGPLLKPSETFYKDAFLLVRKTSRLVPLSANRPLRAMTFPEFLPDGRILLLDQASTLRAEEVVRTVIVR